MKSAILFTAALAGLVAVSSCQKDKAVNTPNNTTSTSRSVNAAKMKPVIVFGPDRYRVFYDHGGSAIGCVYTGGNCLDDIIIVAPRVRQLMSLIVGGGDYSSYIKSNLEDLSADLPGEYLQGVIDAKFTLSVGTNTETQMQYLKFNDGQNIALVIPVSSK